MSTSGFAAAPAAGAAAMGRTSLASSGSNSNSSASIASTGSSSKLGGGGDQPAKPPSSNADYDNIRNTTLLFFLDRLYTASRDGKEARSLHELSCLFGTKEFTKEMRQIVGASRNGLKRFLQSYPSLFTIEGDKVLITQLKQEAQAPARDYNQEAVEYFRQKLLQFGTSLVPIRNLFGYRSQASQEVRHVSGKNTRDFRQFLRAHDDVFEILADEHVVLKTTLRELEQSLGQSQSELQSSLPPSDEITMDPYLNKQFAHSIEQCIRRLAEQEAAAGKSGAGDDAADASTFKISLASLHSKISESCSNELFLKMVKTLDDLRVFLRMHPKLFKRTKGPANQEEFVSLLSESERKELEAQLYPSLGLQFRQHSALARTQSQQTAAREDDCDSSQPTSLSQQPLSLPPASLLEKRRAQNQNQPEQQQQPSNGAGAPRSPSTTTPTTSQPSQGQNNPTSGARSADRSAARHQASALRATAPPFVPSSRLDKRPPVPGLGQRQNSQLHQQSGRPADAQLAAMQQRSVSNLGPRWQQLRGGAAAGGPPLDQRGAIRNYLMKAQSNDHSSVSNNLHWSSAVQQQHQQQQQQQHQCLGQSNSFGHASSRMFNQQLQPTNGTSADYLRARTVDIVREASNIVTRIMNACDAVAFDCKGYNLGFEGQITLIQFGFLPDEARPGGVSSLAASDKENNNHTQRPKPEVCVFDLITNPELAYCLKPLLESDKVVKVVHDVRNKSNALHVQFNIVLSNVFDTQVANLVIQQQDTGKPAYKSRYISMSKLCEIYGDEELMRYRNMIKSKTRHNPAAAAGQQAGGATSRQIKDVNYWRARPLSNAMIFEATMDVYCLVGGIYQNLNAKIKPEYKPLFDQLNLEGVLARIKPDEIKSAKKERKIDLEVIDLKRKLYGDTKSSIVLSNREIRLLRHIDLTDEVRNKIRQCKKVAKKLERLDMKAAQLKSLASQLSSETDAEPSGQARRSSSASLSSQANSLDSSNSNHNPGQGQAPAPPVEQSVSDRAADVMTSLMDSSVFDELKDKMIESSSLLESLDDDDDEHLGGAAHQLSLHSHSGTSHDCCHCQCHRSSAEASVADPQDLSLKSNVSTSNTNANTNNAGDASSPLGAPTTKPDDKETSTIKPEPEPELVRGKPLRGEAAPEVCTEDQEAKAAAAVDMAVQCDLLS